MRLEPTGTPERQYTWTVDHLNVYKQKILSIFPILGHLGDFLELKSSPKPVRSLDYIDRADSNRRTVSRRDKISQRRPLSLKMCHTRVFCVTIDSEPVEESFMTSQTRFYQWDPSIISTEPTRTDGPSPRRDNIFAAASLSLRMCHMRVFWITLDSESVELISGLSD